MPVPVRFETCGLPIALSLTRNVPVRAPACVGLKTTLIVQLEPPARLDPQVVPAIAKSPVVDAEIPVSATLCLFLSVNVFAALVPPTTVFAKLALAGVSVACGPPVPLSGTLCGLFAALSLMVTAPVRSPTCVGVKLTLNLQLAPTARVAPQVFTGIAKSLLATMLAIFSVAAPVFDMVTAFAADVLPTANVANVNEAGDSVTTGWLAAVTVS